MRFLELLVLVVLKFFMKSNNSLKNNYTTIQINATLSSTTTDLVSNARDVKLNAWKFFFFLFKIFNWCFNQKKNPIIVMNNQTTLQSNIINLIDLNKVNNYEYSNEKKIYKLDSNDTFFSAQPAQKFLSRRLSVKSLTFAFNKLKNLKRRNQFGQTINSCKALILK